MSVTGSRPTGGYYTYLLKIQLVLSRDYLSPGKACGILHYTILIHQPSTTSRTERRRRVNYGFVTS
jgi:hypothetical protein